MPVTLRDGGQRIRACLCPPSGTAICRSAAASAPGVVRRAGSTALMVVRRRRPNLTEAAGTGISAAPVLSLVEAALAVRLFSVVYSVVLLLFCLYAHQFAILHVARDWTFTNRQGRRAGSYRFLDLSPEGAANDGSILTATAVHLDVQTAPKPAAAAAAACVEGARRCLSGYLGALTPTLLKRVARWSPAEYSPAVLRSEMLDSLMKSLVEAPEQSLASMACRRSRDTGNLATAIPFSAGLERLRSEEAAEAVRAVLAGAGPLRAGPIRRPAGPKGCLLCRQRRRVP